jgi:PTH2 family peptidyl-tRNA hydrolase
MIVDKGLTVFKGIPTKTCLAIGPHYPEKIDIITGHLPLL